MQMAHPSFRLANCEPLCFSVVDVSILPQRMPPPTPVIVGYNAKSLVRPNNSHPILIKFSKARSEWGHIFSLRKSDLNSHPISRVLRIRPSLPPYASDGYSTQSFSLSAFVHTRQHISVLRVLVPRSVSVRPPNGRTRTRTVPVAMRADRSKSADRASVVMGQV